MAERARGSLRERDYHPHHQHHHAHHPPHHAHHAASRRRPAYNPDSCWYKTKEFLRKTIAFLFGHVGICGLVVGYIIMGAFAFMAIESEDQKRRYADVVKAREDTIQNLWNITHSLNVLYPNEWNESVAIEVLEFQNKIVQFVNEGYDGKDYNQSRASAGEGGDDDAEQPAGAWSFSASFLYCLTVITTIGYGNIAPRTIMGKMVTIVYAMVGMPLFLLYVSNMGDFLATCFRWGYVKLCKCSCLSRPAGHQRHHLRGSVNGRKRAASAAKVTGDDPGGGGGGVHQRRLPNSEVVELYDQQQPPAPAAPDYQTATVPITISITVMVSYVVGGAVLFKQWETDWNYLDGSYFCFISLSTTGFGDLVPGEKISGGGSSSGVELSLIFCSMYLIIGMALIAMCFNLMQEEVIAKMRKCGAALGCLKPDAE